MCGHKIMWWLNEDYAFLRTRTCNRCCYSDNITIEQNLDYDFLLEENNVQEN